MIFLQTHTFHPPTLRSNSARHNLNINLLPTKIRDLPLNYIERIASRFWEFLPLVFLGLFWPKLCWKWRIRWSPLTSRDQLYDLRPPLGGAGVYLDLFHDIWSTSPRWFLIICNPLIISALHHLIKYGHLLLLNIYGYICWLVVMCHRQKKTFKNTNACLPFILFYL